MGFQLSTVTNRKGHMKVSKSTCLCNLSVQTLCVNYLSISGRHKLLQTPWTLETHVKICQSAGILWECKLSDGYTQTISESRLTISGIQLSIKLQKVTAGSI